MAKFQPLKKASWLLTPAEMTPRHTPCQRAPLDRTGGVSVNQYLVWGRHPQWPQISPNCVPLGTPHFSVAPHRANPGSGSSSLCLPVHPLLCLPPASPTVPSPACYSHLCTGLGCPSLPSLPCPPSNLNSNVISFLGPALKDRGAGFFLCNYILLSLFMVSEGCLSIYVAVSTLFVLLYLAGTLWVLSVCVCV